MLLRRLRYPNTTGLILRRTYPDLYKSHIVKLFEEYPETREWWREQSKELRLPNGSRLFFGSAEHPGDIAAFHSSEFADIMPDEAQEFSQGELEQLSGSNRCTSNPDITPKMIYTFMPGISETGLPPKGLPYLKRVFVDKKIEGVESRQSWAFVQAFSWDNIEWARKELERDGVSEAEFYSWPHETRREYFVERTEYGAVLNSLTNQALRDAWLDGKFDVFQGQYFANFSKQRHVISRVEAEARIKPWHKRWLSGDWGFDHPGAVHWHVIDEHQRVITYKELWGRGIGETELGKKIGELSIGKFDAFPYSWDFGKLSPRDPGKRRSIGQMISEAMPAGLPKPHPAESKPGSRISGWRLMSQMLDSDLWQIVGEDCPKLVECIPSLVRDPDNTEDVLKVDFADNGIGDDAADSARYGLQFMLGSSIKSRDVLLAERLGGIRSQFAGAMPKAEGEVVTVKGLIEKLGGRAY